MLIGEPKRSRAGGCDAKHAALPLEGCALNLCVLVHVPKQQPAAGHSSAPRRPDCHAVSEFTAGPPGMAPHTQTSTRKAMFLTTMPAGSWMMRRAHRSPFAFSTTSKAVCTIAHSPGAMPAITHTAIATSTIPSALRNGGPNRGPSRGTAVTTSTCDCMRPRILHHSPSYNQTAATLARMMTNGGNTIAMLAHARAPRWRTAVSGIPQQPGQ